MTPPKLIMVRWEDAKVIEGGTWCENKPRVYEPHVFVQIGFLTLDAPEGIHLVAAWHPEQTSPPDQIPRAMIREMVELVPKIGKKGGR
ncbi:hypothetical protein [Methylibium sp.]|uniref:hypothetical protein n=1 Tax=Methylibium sp. TaxID=2067992 RepID=UPI001833B531|nr:hypothetical protein [Methylibium sp.]MBA3588219.1 hypothetical protein [Methylibium sp.]